MEYFKIKSGNRYIKQLDEISKIISILNFFNQNNYRIPKNNFKNFQIRSKEMLVEIDNYFENNLFSKNEKKLLIYNLLLLVENYGKNAILRIAHSSAISQKEIFSSKYNINYNGEISESMILAELDHYPKTDTEIIKGIIKFREALLEEFKEYDRNLNKYESERVEKELEQTSKEIYKSQDKPVFSSSIVDVVYEILKEHFDKEEHKPLENLLKNNTTPTNKLYFKNNGNKLTDAFKKLIEAHLITQCIKSELEKWVCDNFQFKYLKNRQNFNPRTVQDVISNKISKQHCKTPLFTILNGNIIKA